MCLYSLQESVKELEEELRLEYIHTMNRMCFDKVVQESPEEFPHIKIPQKEPEKVPEKGREMDIKRKEAFRLSGISCC